MGLRIKASDLYYKYPRDTTSRGEPKFMGKPDPAPFNRDDLYEVVPLLEKVMDELERDDGETLHLVEELLIRDLPGFLVSRAEVFDFLTGCAREALERR